MDTVEMSDRRYREIRERGREIPSFHHVMTVGRLVQDDGRSYIQFEHPLKPDEIFELSPTYEEMTLSKQRKPLEQRGFSYKLKDPYAWGCIRYQQGVLSALLRPGVGVVKWMFEPTFPIDPLTERYEEVNFKESCRLEWLASPTSHYAFAIQRRVSGGSLSWAREAFMFSVMTPFLVCDHCETVYPTDSVLIRGDRAKTIISTCKQCGSEDAGIRYLAPSHEPFEQRIPSWGSSFETGHASVSCAACGNHVGSAEILNRGQFHPMIPVTPGVWISLQLDHASHCGYPYYLYTMDDGGATKVIK